MSDPQHFSADIEPWQDDDDPCQCCKTARSDQDLCQNCQHEYHQWLMFRELNEREQDTRVEYVSVIRSEAGMDDDLEGAPF